MKILFLTICILSISALIANAEYFILVEKQSKEIVNIADKESDFQIAESDKAKLDVQEMNGEFKDVELEAPIQDYKLSNGKFILNTKKISDRENEKEAAVEKENKRKTDLESAKGKLMALGLTNDEVEAFSR